MPLFKFSCIFQNSPILPFLYISKYKYFSFILDHRFEWCSLLCRTERCTHLDNFPLESRNKWQEISIIIFHPFCCCRYFLVGLHWKSLKFVSRCFIPLFVTRFIWMLVWESFKDYNATNGIVGPVFFIAF